ncbi:hypothetical protein HRD57_01930 [Tetragenococcus halophilus]|nr:hypothetical protein [Tetragenococcus halophilus]
MYGSDIDTKALEYAQKNLNLLTPEGLSKKKRKIYSTMMKSKMKRRN